MSVLFNNVTHTLRQRSARVRSWASLLALTVLASAVVTTTWTTTAGAAPGTDSLYPGESLSVGQHLYSGDRAYDLVMQGDGNLVLYWRGKPIWYTSTSGRGANRVVLQGDGNLVLYTGAGSAVWSSGTYGTSPGRLVLQSDANLVLYSASGSPSWASSTRASRWSDGDAIPSSDGQFRAVMQGDGNFVLYAPSGALWTSNTRGAVNAFLVLQGDGNLVIYSNTVAVWNAGTWRSGPTSVTTTTSGQLQVVAASGAVAWSVPAPALDPAISELLTLFNNYRASLGLVQEAYSEELSGYSRSCAAGMAATNAPLAHCRNNEIIQYNTVGTAQAWFTAWLNSPPHKQLIEWASNRFVGAAAVFSPSSGRHYIAMNFA